MIDEEDLRRPTPRVRLRLMKSPVVGSTESQDDIVEHEVAGIDQWHKPATLGAAGFATFRGEHKGLPLFRKFEDASLLELFTDLFFAANYTVFTQTQQVTDTNTLAAYIGYFCTLWVTWLLVGLYDVRFVTDCVFERATRAVHLGVLIGFAVVAPKFDPSDQDRTTMRIMSVILSISRFTLGIEYLSVLWHVRKFKKALLPIAFQVALSFAAGFVYLGITFRFRDYNSRVFVVWYSVAFFELTFTTGASAYWDVLAFTRTHLMKRLALLTVIILGDGIIVLAQDIVVIVQTPQAWNELTIGIVTAACAAIYSVFLVYFDWIREQYLPRWRQLYWVSLHLPFHLALVLFMHGFTQLIMWTKIIDVIQSRINEEYNGIGDLDQVGNSSSIDITKRIDEIISPFFDDYGKLNSMALFTYNIALSNISMLPDSTWKEHPGILKAIWLNGTVDGGFEKSTTYQALYDALVAISASMYTSLFETYGVEVAQDLAGNQTYEEIIFDSDFQLKVFAESTNRFNLVFVYGYIASGLTLIFMVVLTIIARKHPWKPWPIVRNVINVLAGIAMAAMAGLAYSEDFGVKYILNGWPIPTITIIWFFILVLTHLGSATPVVAEAIKKRSISPLREDTRKPSDQRTLSWHEGGGVNPGHMAQHNLSSDSTQHSTFYGQVGNDGTDYGRNDRFLSGQETHEGTTGHGTSTSYQNDATNHSRRPTQPSPVSSAGHIATPMRS